MKIKKLIVKKIIIMAAAFIMAAVIFSFMQQDVTTMSIATGIGIDYDGKEYTVTIETIPHTGIKSNITAHTGNTIDAAIADVELLLNKKVKFGQCILIVLGDGMCENNIAKILPPMIKRHVQYNTAVAAANKDAAEIFAQNAPEGEYISTLILKTFFSNEDSGDTVLATFRELFEQSQTPGRVCILPRIAAFKYDDKNKAVPAQSGSPQGAQPDIGEDSEKPAMFDALESIAVSEGKKRCVLTREETIGFNLLTRKIENFNISFDSYTAQLKSARPKNKFYFENGLPAAKFCLSFSIENLIASEPENNNVLLSLNKNNAPAETRMLLKQSIQNYIDSALNAFANSGADILNLAQRFYAYTGNEWKIYAQNNPQFLEDIKINIEIEIKNL